MSVQPLGLTCILVCYIETRTLLKKLPRKMLGILNTIRLTIKILGMSDVKFIQLEVEGFSREELVVVFLGVLLFFPAPLFLCTYI